MTKIGERRSRATVVRGIFVMVAVIRFSGDLLVRRWVTNRNTIVKSYACILV